MTKIKDHLMQYDYIEESRFLTDESFPVNMRFFRDNVNYRKVIRDIIEYMQLHLVTAFDDYDKARGVAAPTLGFPLTIIAYKDSFSNIHVLINPKITNRSLGICHKYTGCGCFSQKIGMDRNLSIDIKFFDINGDEVIQKGITQKDCGFIIQHEINHLEGKLVPKFQGIGY